MPLATLRGTPGNEQFIADGLGHGEGHETTHLEAVPAFIRAHVATLAGGGGSTILGRLRCGVGVVFFHALEDHPLEVLKGGQELRFTVALEVRAE